MALARLGQGWIALQRHPDTEVWAQLEESLADLKKYGDPWWIRTWLLILGRLAFMQADAQRALALMEESLAHARAAGDASVQAWVLLFLGQLALTQGELATAQARLEESLALTQGTHESSITPHVLTLQSWIRWRQGKTDEARASFNEVIRLMREQGNLWAVARVLLLLGNMAVGHGDVAEARADYAESLVLARHLQVEGFIASSLKGMGVVMAAEGQLVMAAWLWGAAELLQESQDVSLPAAVYEQAVQAARSQLGKQAFDAAWAQGRTLTLEQALAAQGAATRPTAAPAGPSSVPPVPKTPTYPAGLTAREVEILLLVAQGLSDAQVAEQLVISRRTVNWHLTSIYSKLGVSSRAAATRYAIEHQLC